MRLRFLAFAIVVMGCGDDSGADSGQDDGSTGTGSSTSITVTSTPMTMTTTMSTSGAETTDDPSSSSTPDESSDETDGSTLDDSTTAPPGDCAFAPAVDEALEGSTREPIDCGAVTLDDDVAAWQAAHDCAREATLDQLSYKVLWQYDGGGTLRDGAFASEVGEVYAIYRFDDDAAAGTTSITRTTCTGISTLQRCVVTPGDICIDCIRPGDAAELCD